MVFRSINFSVLVRDANFSNHKMVLLAFRGVCTQNELLDRVVSGGLFAFVL